MIQVNKIHENLIQNNTRILKSKKYVKIDIMSILVTYVYNNRNITETTNNNRNRKNSLCLSQSLLLYLSLYLCLFVY